MSAWSVRRRLGVFAIALAAAFGAGLGVGALGDEIDRSRPAAHDGSSTVATRATATTVPAATHEHGHFGGGR